MKSQVVICIDECVWSHELAESESFIFFKRETKDEDIIKAILAISNNVIFFTKNDDDFNGHLKHKDIVVRISGKLSQETLNSYLPSAAQIVKTRTGLKNDKVNLKMIDNDVYITSSSGKKYKVDPC